MVDINFYQVLIVETLSELGLDKCPCFFLNFCITARAFPSNSVIWTIFSCHINFIPVQNTSAQVAC